MALLKNWLITPLAFQLWFLRNLIILVFFSPVIYWLLIKLRLTGVILIGLMWFLAYNLIVMPLLFSLFFYVLGGYLRIFFLSDVNKLDVRINPILGCFIWLVIALSSFIFQEVMVSIVLSNLSILAGIVVFWSILSRQEILLFFDKKFMQGIMPFSFFIYLFHEPLLTVIIKFMFAILRTSDRTSLITFVTAPVLSITICIIVGKFLKIRATSIYNLITGTR